VNVKPMLGDWEVPNISSIRTLERRAFVELPVPGRVGSLFQDLNSTPTRIAISGSLFGDQNRDDFLEQVRGKFKEGAPVTFVADIVTATEVQHVIVETLDFRESAQRPDETHFLVVLRESPPPPPSANPLGALEAGLDLDALGMLDTITGALGVLDGLGSVPDLADPTPPLTGALDGVTAATAGLGDALTPLAALFAPPA
jgi:hypothetical protein